MVESMVESKVSTFIIAEAGVNHNGDIELAKQLIDVAAEAGANAVKFQTFKAEKLVSLHAPKAAYQIETTDSSESQFDMIRKLELSRNDHHQLIQHAKLRNIQFLSTPFDVESLKFLSEELGLQTIKVPSGEITNAPFLLDIARFSKKIILSTGMCTLSEIEAALGVIAYGFMNPQSSVPSTKEFEFAYISERGQQILRENVTLLHCTTEYPAPFNEVNLRSIETMSAAFGLPVGYSDHTAGIHIALAAVALGAKVIEKHFTLDRSLPGPDHKASLEPHELMLMISNIREIELALGDGIKRPSMSELKNRSIARKSLVADKIIAAGETLTMDNLTCKRPGTGISPFDLWKMLGQVSTRCYEPDEIL